VLVHFGGDMRSTKYPVVLNRRPGHRSR